MQRTNRKVHSGRAAGPAKTREGVEPATPVMIVPPFLCTRDCQVVVVVVVVVEEQLIQNRTRKDEESNLINLKR